MARSVPNFFCKLREHILVFVFAMATKDQLCSKHPPFKESLINKDNLSFALVICILWKGKQYGVTLPIICCSISRLYLYCNCRGWDQCNLQPLCSKKHCQRQNGPKNWVLLFHQRLIWGQLLASLSLNAEHHISAYSVSFKLGPKVAIQW